MSELEEYSCHASPSSGKLTLKKRKGDNLSASRDSLNSKRFKAGANLLNNPNINLNEDCFVLDCVSDISCSSVETVEKGGKMSKLPGAANNLGLEIAKLLEEDDVDETSFRKTMIRFMAFSFPKLEEISSINLKLSDIKKQVDKNALSISTLSGEVNSYKLEVSALREELSAAKLSFEASKENIIAEMSDRNRRYTNLILHNIAEFDSTKEDETDAIKVKKILSVFNNEKMQLSTNLDNLFVRRFGPENQSKVRPICVKMNSRDDVMLILSNRELVKNYMVNADRTADQRKYLKMLNEKKNEHNALNPADPVTIKYKNNVPIIVKKSSAPNNPNSENSKNE